MEQMLSPTQWVYIKDAEISYTVYSCRVYDGTKREYFMISRTNRNYAENHPFRSKVINVHTFMECEAICLHGFAGE